MPTEPRDREDPTDDALSYVEQIQAPRGENLPADRGLETTARIREAWRADAATSSYADRLRVILIGARAVIRGEVDDVGDSAAVVAVVERVTGIDEVIDETTLKGG